MYLPVIIVQTIDVHETTVDKIESDVSTAWKGLEVSGSSMSNASKVTLAQKLAKLQVQILYNRKYGVLEREKGLMLRSCKIIMYS